MQPGKPGLPRRTFLRSSTALAAAAVVGCRSSEQGPRTIPATQEAILEPAEGLGAEEAHSPTVGGEKFVRVLLREADHSPLASDRARLLHARDLGNDPLPQTIVRAEGRARIALANEPLQMVVRLKVPDFGEVYCYADNDGRGYTKVENVDFVVDAAATRLRRVHEAIRQTSSLGMPSDPQMMRHLERAARPIPDREGSQRTDAAYEALAHGLHAGERFALNHARHRIARFAEPRKDFGFGVMASRYGSHSGYDKAIEEAFNFATVAWYTWKEPAPPYVDYARMDGSIDWCLARNIEPKGFGYCYMARGATPEWSRPIEVPTTQSVASGDVSKTRRVYNENWPYEKLRALYADINRQTCAHYKQKYGDRVPTVEVLNEAHDKANLWHMSQQEILDMARSVTRAAREGHPTIKRMINHCCQWAEYAVRRNADGSRRWSPFTFAKDCLDNGVEFETLGLQLYYPQYDLFEIDRMLERHTILGKPIHITEVATASEDGLDPTSMRPKTAAPGWHGPWSEAMQADWAEAVYTLCYSKPLYEVVGWWDLADVGGHFWPHGGLLKKDMTPKESYHRLVQLQKNWGVSKKQRTA